MKSNDIRIGNWVEYAGKGKVLVINSEADYDNVYLECDESFEWTEFSRLKGIPITKEILDNSGIESILWNGVVKQYYIMVAGEHCALSLTFGEMKGFPDRLDKAMIGAPPHTSGSVYGTFDIKYIHQLQNIYYSLKGEELNITI